MEILPRDLFENHLGVYLTYTHSRKCMGVCKTWKRLFGDPVDPWHLTVAELVRFPTKVVDVQKLCHQVKHFDSVIDVEDGTYTDPIRDENQNLLFDPEIIFPFLCKLEVLHFSAFDIAQYGIDRMSVAKMISGSQHSLERMGIEINHREHHFDTYYDYDLLKGLTFPRVSTFTIAILLVQKVAKIKSLMQSLYFMFPNLKRLRVELPADDLEDVTDAEKVICLWIKNYDFPNMPNLNVDITEFFEIF